MAPIEPSPTAEAESAIRDTIQSLYNVMLHTSAYDAAGPHTTLDALVSEVHVLSKALQGVAHTAASGSVTGDHPLPSVPRDLLQYVEAGRNPDIYTREFVELVRRTNQLRAGKRAAFGQFRDVLAGQIRSALPELRPDVDAIVEATGGEGGGSSNTKPAPKPATATTAIPATAAAPASTLPTRSLSASASASASPLIGLAGGGTPGSDGGGGGVIDMLGLLPGTPQPGGATTATTTTTAAAAGASFASSAGGGADSKPDGSGMQT